MPAVDFYTFDDKTTLAQAYADQLAHWLESRGTTHIALSGGSTPAVLFKELAAHYRDRINWKQVHLFWGDERCVPPDHPQSNFGTTQELLLQHIDLPAEHIHRIRGEEDPQTEARRYAQEIENLLPAGEGGHPAFDLIMLGMGADGHTASIFPDQMELLHQRATCATARHPESGQLRITLTGPVLNAARHVTFLVTGTEKKERVREILGQLDAGKRYPSAYIHPVGRLSWWLDEAAAAELDPTGSREHPPII